MVELIIVISLVSFCIFTDKLNIIYLLIVLFPFHSFIKNCLSFFAGGGNLFAAWKELAILIFFYKVGTKKHLVIPRDLTFFISTYIAIIFLFYAMSNRPVEALAYLRDYIFPLLLFSALYMCPFNEAGWRKIIFFICLASIASCIGGLLQMFWFNLPISTINGRIDFIDNAGYIKYKTTSARIMGYERMAGVIGGPNDFGVFTSFIITFLSGVLLTNIKKTLNKTQLKFIYLSLILSIICILFSFSRAGWAISIIGVVVICMMNKVKIKSKFIIAGLFTILGIAVITSIYFPFVIDVITDTFSGKEVSAADRGNNFLEGLQVNISEPFGHGVGTTDHRNDNYEFFAESAFMNVAYEIGLFGFMLLLSLHFLLLKRIYSYKKANSKPFSSVSIAITIGSLIASFVSVNTYGMPYIYLWWLVLGLGINRSINYNNYENKIQDLKLRHVLA